jgi:hypothetical protein
MSTVAVVTLLKANFRVAIGRLSWAVAGTFIATKIRSVVGFGSSC